MEVALSTAAPVKSPTPSGTFEIARPLGKCCSCLADIAPQQKFLAALRETPAGFERLDCCTACQASLDRTGVVAFWHTVMPDRELKKKVFVDDQVLCDLFERLADVQEPAKVNFRFVLGLILMRKRLIVYESTRQDGRGEVWTVRPRGRETMLELLNPRLDEQQVQEVAGQIGQILNQEL